MTDRELLEAAAKAAGIDMQTKAMFGVDPEPGYYLAADGTAPIWFWWNPLTDDGDVFRLSVKLGLDVSHNSFGNVIVDHHTVPRRKTIVMAHGADPYEATRRAIVRAAAAMAWVRPNVANNRPAAFGGSG